MEERQVDFGNRKVSEGKKRELVNQVFAKVAPRYNLMNDLMSFGSHRILKQLLLNMSEINPASKVLDLAGGTGDMTSLFASVLENKANLTLADYNQDMINYARDRLINEGLTGINYVVNQAESLPFASSYFDCICISFGFRNFTDKALALKEAERTLKAGGTLLILEFSRPTNGFLNAAYKGFQTLWPVAGKLLVGDDQPYKYLIESIEKHPKQAVIKQMFEDAGFFNVSYNNFLGGVAAIHKGYKVIGNS